MGKALTALAVERMQPGPARREVPDGFVGGLYLVVQPSGAKSWAICYRADGTPRKHTIGTWPRVDLAGARKLAQSSLREAAEGRDPSTAKKAARQAAKAPPDRRLVEAVVDTFAERYLKPTNKPSSAKETERNLRKEVIPRWQGRSLASVTRADVHDLLDAIVDRGAPVQANRTLASFRKLCAWAVERGLVETSPCEKVKAPTPERSRDRVLTDDELRAVWHGCAVLGWPSGPMVRMLVLTGQRRDEVAKLRWSEVDLGARLWTLPRERAKNSIEHTVPLSDAACSLLESMPRVGDFVFTTDGRSHVSGYSKIKLRLDAAVAESRGGAAIPAWVFHDLRRTAATGMARRGIGLPVIEKVLNHVSGSFGGIVGVYQRHGFADEKRQALDIWGGFVQQLTAEKSEG